jgi:hypothetical protein
MTTKEQLMNEIEDFPEFLMIELLNFLLFLKDRYADEIVTSEEEANILEARTAYLAGDYMTIDQYEAARFNQA